VQQKESAIRSRRRRAPGVRGWPFADLSDGDALGVTLRSDARIQLDLILLPHDSREMNRSTNHFHRSGCRLRSAHMKEAGDAPGLQFGDPFADQDWIMSSTVRRTASLVS